jgi:KRAB domain-containing zinc finger protein
MFADLNEPTKQAIDSEIVEEIIEEETIPENYEEFVEENEISEEIIENESNIENFETSQSGVYDFKCHICNQQFSKMFELVNHTRVNHKTIPKVACECGKYLSTWESLVKHYKKHSNQEKPFTCHSCDKSFTTKTGLHIHQQHAHHKTQQELTCETCGKVFKDLQVLKNHKRTHLPDEEKFCFECEICGKKVINKFSLKYHIDNVHNGVKVCSCPICGKNFGHRSNLSSHMISHTNDKVECDICGKIFKNQISLRTHLKSFHNPNNKKLKCNECDKTFRTKSELSRHTRIHMDQQRNQDEYEVIVFECQTDQ